MDNLRLSSKNKFCEFNATIENEKIIVYRRHDTMLGGNTANALLLELRGVGSSSNIFDPNVQRTKGLPRGALNQSRRRDPSGFEHVEGAKGRRRCSHCGDIGHNACTCNHNQALLASSPSPSLSSPCL